MATFGMRYPRVCPVDVAQNESGIEIETLGVGMVVGRAISATTTLNIAVAYQYADDGSAEVVRDFVNGTIELGLDDLPIAIKSVILGQKMDDDKVLWGDRDDNPPYLRLAYIRPRILRRKRLFTTVCYMRTIFSPPNTNDQTKGETIELRGATISGSLMLNADGKWIAESEHDELAAAITWVNKMTNVPAANGTGG